MKGDKIINMCLFAVLVFALLGITIFVITGISFYFSPDWLGTLNYTVGNNPGDSSWGFSGILLTIATGILMYLAFRYQQIQLNDMRQSSRREKFENTFYNLLGNYHDIRDLASEELANNKISGNDSVHPMESAWLAIKKEYGNIAADDDIKSSTRRLQSGYDDLAIRDSRDSIDKFITEILDKNNLSLSYYIRYLTNLVNFVKEEWKDDMDSDKVITDYLSFIQSQMSDYELAFLFYYALSERTKTKDKKYALKENMDKYQFLSSIPQSVLLDRSHHKIYGNTIFLFLGKREREEKEEYIKSLNIQ